MTISERIQRIEDKVIRPGGVPGTSFGRFLKSEGGYGWVLGIGHLTEPKTFFYRDTLEACLNSAEEYFNLCKNE